MSGFGLRDAHLAKRLCRLPKLSRMQPPTNGRNDTTRNRSIEVTAMDNWTSYGFSKRLDNLFLVARSSQA